MVQPTSWQPIFGDFDFSTDAVKFLGSIQTEPDTGKRWPLIGVAMNNVSFNGGALCATVEYKDAKVVPSAQLVLYRNAIDGSTLSAGLQGAVLDHPQRARFVLEIYDASRQTDRMQILARLCLKTLKRAVRTSGPGRRPPGGQHGCTDTNSRTSSGPR